MKQFWAVTTLDDGEPIRVTVRPHRSAKQAAREILPGTNGSGVLVKPLGRRVPPMKAIRQIDGWRPLLPVTY